MYGSGHASGELVLEGLGANPVGGEQGNSLGLKTLALKQANHLAVGVEAVGGPAEELDLMQDQVKVEMEGYEREQRG